MEESLARLEQRIAALEAHIASLTQADKSINRLITPVEVVTPEGQIVLKIDHELHKTHVSLYNIDGHAVATFGVDGTQAGYITIRNAEGHSVGYLDVELSGARLTLHDHTQNGGVVVFGGDSSEDQGGGIHIIHTNGGLSMSLWSQVGGGELRMYDGSKEEQERLVLPSP
jgi:hypothetical protein